MAQTPFIIVSDSISLGAGASGDLRLAFPAKINVKIIRLLVGSTGRFRVDKLTDKAGASYLTKVADSIQLSQIARDVFPIDVTIPMGEELTFTITDLSGAANLIFIGVLGQPVT